MSDRAAEHTAVPTPDLLKLPWHRSNRSFGNAEGLNELSIWSDTGLVATTATIHCGAVVAEDNAAFIVTACNAHDSLLAANAQLEKKYEKAMRGLESLTPSGSEFVGDVERCVQHVQETRSFQFEILKRFKLERDAALAANARLRQALARLIEFARIDHNATPSSDGLRILSGGSSAERGKRMNVSDLMKLSRECDWAADAQVLTFDPETGNYQPVTGATYDDKEIKLYTDCDDCGETPCELHLKYPSSDTAFTAAEHDAMQHRAESAESAWQASEAANARLREALEAANNREKEMWMKFRLFRASWLRQGELTRKSDKAAEHRLMVKLSDEIRPLLATYDFEQRAAESALAEKEGK